MQETALVREQTAGSRRDRGAGWTIVVLSILAGALLTIFLAVTTTDSYDRTHGRRMEFGAPFVSVVQDQTASDPPPNTRSGLSSPLEFPVRVRPLPAATDVVVLAAPVAVVLGTGWWLVRRSRRDIFRAD
ncbi:hypothetical protein [Nocardioides sp. Iso805N]|uniref:hypothetical protein n=1 Tax=Nocardioides sp. Iso805N TaxID=1283287 RepID=UPI00037CADD0|nr:hypothetical protein [Nocardioides sp. Iso805N]